VRRTRAFKKILARLSQPNTKTGGTTGTTTTNATPRAAEVLFKKRLVSSPKNCLTIVVCRRPLEKYDLLFGAKILSFRFGWKLTSLVLLSLLL
jgi:hypothetical protein